MVDLTWNDPTVKWNKHWLHRKSGTKQTDAMKLLSQLCPDVHSLGGQQKGEAQVKETDLDKEVKNKGVYSLCHFYPV